MIARAGFLMALLAACGATRHHPAQGALGPYSGSVEAGGFVFASGKIGERGGTFEEEANCIYARRFPPPFPARTTVGVAALPGGARVEIAIIARGAGR